MGKGGQADGIVPMRIYSWEEVEKHKGAEDKWIVIDGTIYDITRFSKKHPGGAKIISHFAGQDASEAWYAMHNDKKYVSKYMKSLLVGKVDNSQIEKSELKKDFEQLRETVEKAGWMKVNPWFYIAHLSHIIALEALALAVLWNFGVSWLPYAAAVAILVISQAQAGWSQHDYGHLSVFNSRRINHFVHEFIIGHLKGASSHWWNFRHFQHHVKPNVHKKDPDITLPFVFLLGDHIPVIWGKKKRGKMPYQQQHNYFWLLGPCFLLPVYFHLENIYFVIKRREKQDLAWMVSFFVRWFYCYTPFLGGWGAFGLYMTVRFFESFWFTFCTQMSHLPMEIDHDQEHDWATQQTIATCNVEPGLFNDWFTGHLNYQIEHHFFPMMPRHNYTKVAPLVQSLCKKHNLSYTNKTMFTAFADILRSLKKSGRLWYDAYYE